MLVIKYTPNIFYISVYALPQPLPTSRRNLQPYSGHVEKLEIIIFKWNLFCIYWAGVRHIFILIPHVYIDELPTKYPREKNLRPTKYTREKVLDPRNS